MSVKSTIRRSFILMSTKEELISPHCLTQAEKKISMLLLKFFVVVIIQIEGLQYIQLWWQQVRCFWVLGFFVCLFVCFHKMRSNNLALSTLATSVRSLLR